MTSRISKFQINHWQLAEKHRSPSQYWAGNVADFDNYQQANSNSWVLLGYRVDSPVRPGSESGPVSIRRALSQLSWLPINYLGADLNTHIYDAGDIISQNEADIGEPNACLEMYAEQMSKVLQSGSTAIGLGGSTAQSLGSYQAIQSVFKNKRLGFLALSADMQLTPGQGVFDEIANLQKQRNQGFDYFCLGVNPSLNTRESFDWGAELEVYWRGDVDCNELDMPAIDAALRDFLTNLDCLQLQINASSLSAAYAPGTNQPAALGLSPHFVLRLLYLLKQLCEDCQTQLLLVDVVDFNPRHDIDRRTENTLARLIQAVVE